MITIRITEKKQVPTKRRQVFICDKEHSTVVNSLDYVFRFHNGFGKRVYVSVNPEAKP